MSSRPQVAAISRNIVASTGPLANHVIGAVLLGTEQPKHIIGKIVGVGRCAPAIIDRMYCNPAFRNLFKNLGDKFVVFANHRRPSSQRAECSVYRLLLLRDSRHQI